MGRKSQAFALAEEPENRIARPERLFHEINLLHLEGYYFTFDPKAARVTLDAMQEVERRFRNPEANTVEPVSIAPHPTYGAPSVLAYKVFQAVLKKLSDYGYPAPESVSFGTREILRFIGRKSYGGTNAKELVKVLQQLRHTEINCWMYNRETEGAANFSFSLATSFLYTYQKRGQISRFTLYLHPLIIKSINNHYTFCLNFARTEKLEPISMALFKHVYYHFSNIYSKKQSNNFSFRKDYADICHTWLGGLQVLKYKSKILKEQLGRHLEALKKVHLIKSYEIAKNVEGTGFNIILRPGAGFFEDYNRFYGHRLQNELPFTFTTDTNTIQQPQEIVLYFYQKLYDTDEVDEYGFSEKETAYAAGLLQKHTVQEIKSFIEYGLIEAKKTNFDIKTFGGIKKYYLPYTKELTSFAREKDRVSNAKKKHEEERLLTAYEAYRRNEITKIRERLSANELIGMEDSVRAELEVTHPGSKVLSAWVRQRIDRMLAAKYDVLPFEEWRKNCG